MATKLQSNLAVHETSKIGKLGRIRCATIVCHDLEATVKAYSNGLGYQLIKRDSISTKQAESWNAPNAANLRYCLLGPKSERSCYIRLIEDKAATPPKPYTSYGWTALEISVGNSDASVNQLLKHGFKLLAAPEDLEFSEGKLRAGQVLGPNGEVLYLTQVNEQLDGYQLPAASENADVLFIVVLVADGIEAAMDRYHASFETNAKDVFEAPIPFIAEFCDLDEAHVFEFGASEMVPENYIEFDKMPMDLPRRAIAPSGLPTGIAMVSFEISEVSSTDLTFNSFEIESDLYKGNQATIFEGACGEWIELLLT